MLRAHFDTRGANYKTPSLRSPPPPNSRIAFCIRKRIRGVGLDKKVRQSPIRSPYPGFQIYNLGGGYPVTLEQRWPRDAETEPFLLSGRLL